MTSLPKARRSNSPRSSLSGRTTTTASFGFLNPCAGGNQTPSNRVRMAWPRKPDREFDYLTVTVMYKLPANLSPLPISPPGVAQMPAILALLHCGKLQSNAGPAECLNRHPEILGVVPPGGEHSAREGEMV